MKTCGGISSQTAQRELPSCQWDARALTPPLPPSPFWSTPKAVDCLSVLGVLVDKDLSFEPLLAECCARFVKESQALIATMRDHAMGLFQQVEQLYSRVEPSALHAVAAAASHVNGWAAVAKRLDQAQYLVCKDLLGCPGASLGEGGKSRFMHELGMRWRLSTRVALKVILLRARAMCLLDNQMAGIPFLVSFLGKGLSWTAHAQQVSDSYGVRVDFCEHTVSMRLLQQPDHDAGKRAVLAWKRDVVLPQLELRERQGFQDQSVKWTLRHTAGVQPGTPWNGLHRAFLNFAQSIGARPSVALCFLDLVLPFSDFRQLAAIGHHTSHMPMVLREGRRRGAYFVYLWTIAAGKAA